MAKNSLLNNEIARRGGSEGLGVVVDLNQRLVVLAGFPWNALCRDNSSMKPLSGSSRSFGANGYLPTSEGEAIRVGDVVSEVMER